MRHYRIVCLAVFLVIAGMLGCSGPSLNKELFRPTLPDLGNFDKTLSAKVAVALVGRPASPLGGRMADLYVTALMDAIAGKSISIRLLTPRSDGYPQFLTDMAAGGGESDGFAMAEQARLYGLQGILVLRLSDFQSSNRKGGFWFFRKTRHYMGFSASFELFDPLYAAKTKSAVKEKTIRISADDFESMQYGTLIEIEPLDEAIKETAEEFGKAITKTMAKLPWKTSVLSVENGRILIAGDDKSGLRVGSRMAVYEGRRVMKGPKGGRFIVPGYKIGEMRITSVSGAFCEAEADTSLPIKPGDIAVAIK